MKQILLATLISSVLTGCGGGGSSDSPADTKRAPVKSMTIPVDGYQTFTKDTGPVAKSVAASSGETDYVYRNDANGDELMVDIGFGCEECELQPVVPAIDRIADINDRYAFQNMTNSTVEWKGLTYFGKFPMILDKHTGELLPIVMDNKPIKFDCNIEIDEPFFSTSLRSTIADGNLYASIMVDGSWKTDIPYEEYLRSGLGLFKAKITPGAFVVERLVPEYFHMTDSSIMVNQDSIIIAEFTDTSQDSDDDLPAVWYLIDNGKMTDVTDWLNNGQYSNWRIDNGEFSALHGVTDPSSIIRQMIFTMKWDGTQFVPEATDIEVSGDADNTEVVSLSPMRNNCRITKNAQVDCLEDNQWKKVAKSSFIDGLGGASEQTFATQDTLFWVDLNNWEGAGYPVRVFSYSTATKETHELETGIYIDQYKEDSEVVLSGANAISDSKARVYTKHWPLDGSKAYFKEYYINVEAGLVEQVQTDKLTPIGFMTIDL
ncbi:hypothetical protein ACQKP8_26340 [Photobacterium alginatilyticum]|uniref:hypothetical protein n=1 Tax=Photobacterium alginatilyticum TaxID=1775171 RepID=UPI00406946E0